MLSIDTKWTYNGLQVVRLENDLLQVDILPEAGARIYNLIYKRENRNYLWHHSRNLPCKVPFDSRYDDVWCGGWETLFPNDEAVLYKGITYPDHGETWTLSWDWRIVQETQKEICILFTCKGPITGVLIENELCLRNNESLLRIRYRLKNQSRRTIDYFLRLHPALNITPDSRIDLPAKKVFIDQNYRNRFKDNLESYTWPYILTKDGKKFDMRNVPLPESRIVDFQYAIELTDGWCALTDTKARTGFGLCFDNEVFNSVWLFLNYGGWENLYVAVLEPCTGYLTRLDDAVKSGRFSRLKPGGYMETELCAVIYSGIKSVRKIDRKGKVYGR